MVALVPPHPRHRHAGRRFHLHHRRKPAAVGVRFGAGVRPGGGLGFGVRLGGGVGEPGGLHAGRVNAVSAQPDFVITAPETAVAPGGTGTGSGRGSGSGSGAGGIDSPDAARFRVGAQSTRRGVGRGRHRSALGRGPRLHDAEQHTHPAARSRAHDPRSDVVDRAGRRGAQLAPGRPDPRDHGRTVVPAADVRAVARPVLQYIMPGADQIPNESVGLVHDQPAFIEAYMVGLIHEMARATAVRRLPDRLHGHLLPAVLGRQRIRATARRPDRSDRARRAAQGHPADHHLAAAGSARRTTEPPGTCPTRSCSSCGANCCAAIPTRSSTPRRRSSTASRAPSTTRRPTLHPIFQAACSRRT